MFMIARLTAVFIQQIKFILLSLAIIDNLLESIKQFPCG